MNEEQRERYKRKKQIDLGRLKLRLDRKRQEFGAMEFRNKHDIEAVAKEILYLEKELDHELNIRRIVLDKDQY